MGIFNRKESYELLKLQEEYNVLKQRYESSCVSYDKLEEENEKLQAAIALLNEKNQSESKRNAAYREQIRDLQGKNAKLTTERDTAKNTLANLKTEKEELEAEIAENASKDDVSPADFFIDASLFSPLCRYTSLEMQIARLEHFQATSATCKKNADLSAAVKQKIDNCRKGLMNENAVAEILDDMKDVKVLRDVNFTLDGCSRQIDFIVITPMMVYILDSKSSCKEGDEQTDRNYYSLEKQQENLMAIFEQYDLGVTHTSLFTHMLVYDKNLSPETVKSNYDSSVKDKRVHQRDLETAIRTLDEVAVKNDMPELNAYGVYTIENAILMYCLNNPPRRRCPLCGNGYLTIRKYVRNNEIHHFFGCENFNSSRDDCCYYTENFNIEKDLLPYFENI